jgi:hypothetical protein
MTITLPLQPGEESKLIALAQAKGLSTDALVREALDKILADAPDQPEVCLSRNLSTCLNAVRVCTRPGDLRFWSRFELMVLHSSV